VAHAGEPPTIRGIATITDGDTVRLGPVRVRLEGIDAPESGQHCKMADGTDWPCGAGATKYAGELAGGHVVECVVIGVDKYDRLLGTCGVLDAAGKPDGATLNQRMVTAGLAVAFTRYSQAYVGAEAEAPPPSAGYGRVSSRCPGISGHGSRPRAKRRHRRNSAPSGWVPIAGVLDGREGTMRVRRPVEGDGVDLAASRL
jgi:hypothetical protein